MEADALGRLLKVTEAPSCQSWESGCSAPEVLNYITSYGYDLLDNLTSVAHHGGTQNRSFIYDGLSRLESATNPESGTIAYEYDDVGNLLRKVDARNVATCFYAGTCSHTGATSSNGYDALNRPLLTNYSDSTEPVTYGYDAANGSTCKNEGRLTSVGNVDSTTAFSCHDAIGRVTASTQTTASQSYNFSYEYNNDGTLKSQTYDSGREVAYTYDYAGRPLTAGNATVGPTDYLENAVYAAHGAPSTMGLGNGVDETTLFNSRLQPTTIEAVKSASLMKLDFTYHPAGQTTRNNGNVHSQTINRGGSLIASQTYTYDGVNRLDLATEGAAWTRDYTYDAFGNRGLTTSGITFDATNNRITGASYDGAGNLTVMANVADTMIYDANNKMTSFSLDSSGLVKTGDYVYDAQGNRVQRVAKEGSAAQITTTYVYDAFGKLAAEYSSEAQGSTFTRKFRTADHLGSTRLVTLGDGTADPDAGCLDFYPFGERIEDTVGSRSDDCYDGDDAFAQQFTAKERDTESGLDYFGARYMAAALGRFTSPDPIMLMDQKLFDPQQWSMYSYVRNNPLRLIDPTGMYVCNGTEDQCKDFEKQRQKALESKNSDVQSSASAYGGVDVDNGVTVRFGDPGDGRAGSATASLGVDPNDSSKFRANVKVVMKPGQSGVSLRDTIAHEGTHVRDAQAFAATATMDGQYDLSKNLTSWQTEMNAYAVSAAVLAEAGKTAQIGTCGNGPCIFGSGMSPAQIRATTTILLANPANGYNRFIDTGGPFPFVNRLGMRQFPAISTPAPPRR